MIDPSSIPPEIQRVWIRRLRASWDLLNGRYLDGQLRAPAFEVDRAARRLGRWDPVSRTIGISVEHIVGSMWLEVEETLRHEMAHQVVTELLGGSNGTPHGPLFAKACHLLRVDASPTAPTTLGEGDRRILDRVKKLLALSASDNPHEAQAAMAAANRLLLRHNLAATDAAIPTPGDITYRWLGEPTGRVGLDRRLVSSILTSYFFVDAVWVHTPHPLTGKGQRVLEVVGRRHNIELCAFVHDYLHRTLDRLWASYRTQGAPGRNGVSERHSYRVGVLLGFQEHLKEAREASRREEGLVWLGDPAAEALLRERHPRVSSMRPAEFRGGSAYHDGRAHGRTLRIPGALPDAPVRRGRALPITL